MFASQVKKQVVIDGHTFDIRALSWRSLDKAKDAKVLDGAAHARALGGEVMTAFQGETFEKATKALAEKRATAEGRAKERYEAYDRGHVLTAGVSAIDGKRPVTGDIEDLRPPIADQLHREILDLSLGPIDPAEAAAEGKDSSGASISS